MKRSHSKSGTLKSPPLGQSNLADVLCSDGLALHERGRHAEAIANFDLALSMRPSDAMTHNNRGVALNALNALGRHADALASYDAALALDPQSVEHQWNKSLLQLRMGLLAAGWEGHEWRRKRDSWEPRHFQGPEWDGTAVSGRRVLLYAEQALGDTIQFARFARAVVAAGNEVILEVQRPLALSRGRSGTNRAVETSLGTRWLSRWYRLAGQSQSTGSEPRDPAASLSAVVAPCGRAPDQPAEERRFRCARRRVERNGGRELGRRLRRGRRCVSRHRRRHDEPRSGDHTSIAHLAGALGRPVWIAMRHVTDWRWMVSGETTPWYPTARVFKQTTRGDWGGVFDRVASELARLVGGATAPDPR